MRTRKIPQRVIKMIDDPNDKNLFITLSRKTLVFLGASFNEDVFSSKYA